MQTPERPTQLQASTAQSFLPSMLEGSQTAGADACDDGTQFGADDSGSPRSLVSRMLTIMMTAAMSMAM